MRFQITYYDLMRFDPSYIQPTNFQRLLEAQKKKFFVTEPRVENVLLSRYDS